LRLYCWQSESAAFFRESQLSQTTTTLPNNDTTTENTIFATEKVQRPCQPARFLTRRIFKQRFSHADFSPMPKSNRASNNKKETGVVTGEAGVGAGFERERRRVV
jgi:hypothetical protein